MEYFPCHLKFVLCFTSCSKLSNLWSVFFVWRKGWTASRGTLPRRIVASPASQLLGVRSEIKNYIWEGIFCRVWLKVIVSQDLIDLTVVRLEKVLMSAPGAYYLFVVQCRGWASRYPIQMREYAAAQVPPTKLYPFTLGTHVHQALCIRLCLERIPSANG